ncbi:hypothetical protein [Actinomadura decatromicini]|uniref:Uncharacterized protein n=1 Tax=Actinomadura decatromicini TaxID=2604572 RepID=A0A5D3F9Y3_9ACTN|nr:hypothetical protein [Actinomadura decatromicini]TYK45131.1 hypothetical protein FXF68_31100 [Actinomadura decatromicini]
MADYTFPDDLLQLQRDFDRAERRCQEISASIPSGVEIVEGNVDAIAEQQAALNEARAKRLEVVVALQGHPFWETVENRFDAKEALRKAARQ